MCHCLRQLFLLFSCLYVVVFCAGCGNGAKKEPLRIAVASNFAEPMRIVAERFQEVHGIPIDVSPGSTGKHYAQIRNGAPYDLFFAADKRRPQLLEEQGLIQAGSRFTYVVGKLVLWSPDESLNLEGGAILINDSIGHVAIANPELAPYGFAAKELLEHMGLWNGMQKKLVRGENISHAYQFVATGNAEVGFVSLSQVINKGTNYWVVPEDVYTPIKQQAVTMSEHPEAELFLDFFHSASIQELITEFGYEVF